MYDLSIIIPFLNEEDSLPALFQTLQEQMPRLGPIRTEVIFVDDGSTDRSVELIRGAAHQGYSARLVCLSRNFGSHEAFRAGILVSQGQVVTMLPADMQITFDTLLDLYAAIREGYDIAYAAKSENQSGFLAGLVSRTYGKLMRRFVTPFYPANGADSFMFVRKVTQELNENIEMNSSIMLQIFSLGFRKKEVASTVVSRKHGKSKWSFKRKKKLFYDSFYSFSEVPLRVIITIGKVFATLAFLYALFLLITFLFFNQPVVMGYATLIIVLLLGFGLTNISLGVIGEYLLRDLDASRKRKAFIIDTQETVHENP